MPKSSDVSKIVASLLTAPAQATVHGAREQRKIWIRWLRDVERLVQAAPDEDTKNAILAEHLRLAPTWKISAQLSLALSLRVASIRRFETGGSLGFAVGLLQMSGRFGFSSEETTESALQVRAQYALTNDGETNLAEYLTSLGVDPTDPTKLDEAIAKLGTATTPHSDEDNEG